MAHVQAILPIDPVYGYSIEIINGILGTCNLS
jgi:hypothetical protein